MSTKQSIGTNPLKITEVLQAFFHLDAPTQRKIQEQVKRLSDPQTSERERNRAENVLWRLLQSAGETTQAGPEIGQDERLRSAHRELRAQLEKAESAFAATLERLMAERQLTQVQLAQRIGVGQSAIAMLLKRRCRPQRRTLGKLAQALGVPVEDLWPCCNTGWQSGIL